MNAPLVLPSLGIQPEIATKAIPDDERVWVPQAQDVWFRPLLLNTVTGGWCNLLRVRKSGVLHSSRGPRIFSRSVRSVLIERVSTSVALLP